jgi:hypothetical protein
MEILNRKQIFAAVFSAFFISLSCSAEITVTTIAGNPGQTGYADGLGNDATFHTPLALTVVRSFIYVADTWNSTIRRIDISTHAVTTIAGQPGITGHEDGIGAAATFYTPSGITSNGESLYIADTGNRLIRKFDFRTSVVSTLAVKPQSGRDTSGSKATRSRQFVPYGITTDGVNLYFTDPFFNTIGKIVLSTGVLTLLAGKPWIKGHNDGIGTEAAFSSPMGIATDGASLYISDGNNCVVRKLVLSTGEVSTIAGRAGALGSDDGFGVAALFKGPTGMALIADNLYVADSLNRTIRKIDLPSGHVTTIAGRAGAVGHQDGPGDRARFEGLGGIAAIETDLYIADSLGHTIRRISLN